MNVLCRFRLLAHLPLYSLLSSIGGRVVLEEAPVEDTDFKYLCLVDTRADVAPEADMVLPETSVKLERERERKRED